jgi:hypothetical protein
MADNQLVADGNNDDDIFVYTGGRVPRDVKRAKIDESIDTIPREAFVDCEELIEVKGHNKLKKIENAAFTNCSRLRRLTKMNGVTEIEHSVFDSCTALSDVEFDKLEIIGVVAFASCKSLRSINLPSLRRVEECTFYDCPSLTDAVFSEDLETIEELAFYDCDALRRIAIPLKNGLVFDFAFQYCENLSRVDIVGAGIHKTISSLHMESWRNQMKEEIERINQTLPDTQSAEKGAVINQWIESVLRRMEHYKEEHHVLVKEAMVLLELALWKAKLLDEEGRKCEAEEKMSQKAKIDVNSAREEHRVTCGANIVITNVLPFLALERR